MTENEFDSGLNLVLAANGNMEVLSETRVMWYEALRTMRKEVFMLCCGEIIKHEQLWPTSNFVALVNKHLDTVKDKFRYAPIPPERRLPEHRDQEGDAERKKIFKQFATALASGDREAAKAAHERMEALCK